MACSLFVVYCFEERFLDCPYTLKEFPLQLGRKGKGKKGRRNNRRRSTRIPFLVFRVLRASKHPSFKIFLYFYFFLVQFPASSKLEYSSGDVIPSRLCLRVFLDRSLKTNSSSRQSHREGKVGKRKNNAGSRLSKGNAHDTPLCVLTCLIIERR